MDENNRLDSGVFGMAASIGPHMGVDPAEASTPITICVIPPTPVIMMSWMTQIHLDDS